MTCAACAIAGVRQPAWLGLGECDQLRHGLDRHVVGRHQHQRNDAQQSDRREIGVDVVAELLQRRIDGERRRDRQQRVAIGWLAAQVLGGDDSVGARLVIHHDRLTQLGAKGCAQHACGGVGRAARRKAHDDLDRAVGVVLGRRLRLQGWDDRKPTEHGSGGHAPGQRQGGRNFRQMYCAHVIDS